MSKKVKATKSIELVAKSGVDTGIKASARAKLAEKLGTVLASNYTLTLKTQNYHWHVTGANFISLHEMFGEHYTVLSAATDELAERVRALGHFAPATFREFGKLSFVKEDATAPATAEAMVGNLLVDHEAMARECREVKTTAEDAGDDVTTDMMVERCAYHEKTAWMLRATLGK